jgi:hypothetical protein
MMMMIIIIIIAASLPAFARVAVGICELARDDAHGALIRLEVEVRREGLHVIQHLGEDYAENRQFCVIVASSLRPTESKAGIALTSSFRCKCALVTGRMIKGSDPWYGLRSIAADDAHESDLMMMHAKATK